MFHAPRHFYQDGQARGHVTWEEHKKIVASRPVRDVIYLETPEMPKVVSLKQIAEATMRAFDVQAALLVGPARQPRYIEMRFAAWYISRNHTTASLTQIARLWRRHHTSVLHGIRCVEQFPDAYAANIAAIKREIVQQPSTEIAWPPRPAECWG